MNDFLTYNHILGKQYLPKIKGYQKCSICGKKKVGSQNAWFQDFTEQKRMCSKCIDKLPRNQKYPFKK